MYESHFGLSEPPFQVHPDPSFYFDSKGHSAAYQYLRYGAFQGEGFVVITGDIGTGKTTLLRTLLAELDPQRVVAAQLVSTQLGPDELLAAVAQAFGIDPGGLGKSRLLATLEAYLAGLATSKLRALLIIDEAQNLEPAAIEELRMLSNFQFGSHALLQSFLVGQPELRQLLGLPRMEQLRQRIIASYHLGPMAAAETRAYIEHRLHRAGWSTRPAFDDDAFEAIHRACGGVPRRINRLCNRLLLSAYLESCELIDARRVGLVQAELRAEIDGFVAPTRAAAARSAADAPLLCLAGSDPAMRAAAVLLPALAAREDLPQVELLRLLDGDADAARAAAHDAGMAPATGAPAQGTVPLRASSRAARIAEAVTALAERIDACAPSALLVCGDGPIDVACAVAAAQAGVTVVRVEAMPHGGRHGDAPHAGRALLDQAASLRLAVLPGGAARCAARLADWMLSRQDEAYRHHLERVERAARRTPSLSSVGASDHA